MTTKLSLVIIVITVLALLLLGITLHFIHQTLIQRAGQDLAMVASNVATHLRENMFERTGDITLLADNIHLKESNPQDLTARLTKLNETYQAYLSVSVLTLEGRVIASSSPHLLGRDYREEPVLTLMHNNQQFHIEDAEPLPEFNTLGLTLTAPIFSTSGTLQGLVLAHVGMPYFQEIFHQTTKAFEQQEGGRTTFEWQLLKENGTVIVDSILNEGGQVNLQSQGLPSVLLAAKGLTGYVEEQHLRRHVPVVTGYATTKHSHQSAEIIWHVLVRQDQDAVLAGIRDTESLFFLASIILVGPFIGFLFVAIRKLQVAHTETTQALKLVEQEKVQLSDLSNRLTLATESAHVGIWEWNVRHDSLVWDTPMHRLYGIDTQNFSGTYDTWMQAIHPDDRDRVREEIQLTLKNQHKLHTLFRVVWPDHSIHWLEGHAIVERNAEGEPIRLIGVNTDISEQKHIENETKNRNAMMAFQAKIVTILNEVPEVQPMLQACTEVMVERVNVAFARIWIYNPEEQILELRASAGMYTHLDGAHGRIPMGQFKIGKIASERKPHLTNNVIGDPRVPEQQWAKENGMVAFAGYPLIANKQVVGVMGMFAKEVLSHTTLDMLDLVGGRIANSLVLKYRDLEVRQLAARNALLLQSAGEGIFGLDTQGLTTFVNPAAAHMLGYDPEELVGLPMHVTVHHTKPDGSPYPREECPMYAAFNDGKVHTIESEVLWKKDGTSFPIEYTSTPIRDENDHLVGAVVTFMDITVRKHNETKIKELAARNALLLQSAGEGIFGLDTQGLTTFVNPAAANMLGYTPEELIGAPMHATVHFAKPDGSPYPREECPMYAAFMDGAVHKIDNEVLWRKDGTSFPIEYTSTPLHDAAGNLVGAVVIFSDITIQNQSKESLLQWTQSLEQSNKELDDFAYIASHDLKEPLRGICNFSQFLIEDYGPLLGNEGSAHCHTIMRLSQRMEELTNTLIHFSRIGRTDLAIRDTDLDTIVLGVLEMLHPRLKEEGTTIRYPKPLPIQRCDESRVGEIFRNLITNAMKYNDKPDKWIEIGCVARGNEPDEAQDGTENDAMTLPHERRAPSNKGLHFYVRDNGIGIPEKHFESIFRIFKRLQGRDKFGGGTGAGLTIAQKIIHRHGGHVWLESTVGEGTTFWFTLTPETLKERDVSREEKAFHDMSQ